MTAIYDMKTIDISKNKETLLFEMEKKFKEFFEKFFDTPCSFSKKFFYMFKIKQETTEWENKRIRNIFCFQARTYRRIISKLLILTR